MKDIAEYWKHYIGCDVIVDDKERGELVGGNPVPNSVNQIYYDIILEGEKDEDIMPYNDDYDNPNKRIKPLLRTLNETTLNDEILEELWVVIGGTPHLYEFGKDALKEALLKGYWDDTGIQMDFYTMAAVINKLREMDFDCDDLIGCGLAIDKETVKQ